MNRASRVAFGCAALLIASLLLARVHPFGDAGLYTGRAPQSQIMGQSSVPSAVRATLTAKCANCHSMQTYAPIYGRLAPFSWLLERDVLAGRGAMNLTLWDAYSADQQQVFKSKIVYETRTRDMPLLQYRLVHWKAGVTDADVRSFEAWASEAPAVAEVPVAGPVERPAAVSVKVPTTPGAAVHGPAADSAGDAGRGKVVFEKRCTGCHSMTDDMEGPALQGIYGKTSGSEGGYEYSAPLKDAHIVWNDATLDKWLADPELLVPGNNMEFHVAKPQERRDLIAFLKGGKGK